MSPLLRRTRLRNSRGLQCTCWRYGRRSGSPDTGCVERSHGRRRNRDNGPGAPSRTSRRGRAAPHRTRRRTLPGAHTQTWRSCRTFAGLDRCTPRSATHSAPAMHRPSGAQRAPLGQSPSAWHGSGSPPQPGTVAIDSAKEKNRQGPFRENPHRSIRSLQGTSSSDAVAYGGRSGVPSCSSTRTITPRGSTSSAMKRVGTS